MNWSAFKHLALMFTIGVLTSCASIVEEATSTAPTETKKIAFTFDDAPRGNGRLYTGVERTQALIGQLEKGGVEGAAIFVTTKGIKNREQGRERLLAYAESGHVLANHSHSHGWLYKDETDVDAYIADIDRAQAILADYPNTRNWYRFPYLDEGREADRIANLRTALKERDLKNGYVTIDNYDWYMESLLQQALRDGREVDMDRLRETYIEVLLDSAEFYDDIAKEYLRRSPNHVLLLHENDLAASFISDLADAFRDNGWDIISADEAFADPLASIEPDTTFLGQGRVAAIAHTKGAARKDLVNIHEDEAYLEQLFEERGIFSPKVENQ